MYRKNYSPAQKKAIASAVARKKVYSSQVKAARPSYSGSGKYTKKPAKKASKAQSYKGSGALYGGALGGALGTAIAPGIGTIIGAPLGSLAGYIGDKIFGSGQYEVEQNTVLHNEQPPLFEGSEMVRIRHREYIGDISSTTSFSNRTYRINPSGTLFNWLAPISQQFELYRFNGLIFEFVSTSADALNSTNTALGNVILATNYDAGDPAWTNQQQMLSTTFSNSGKPSVNLLHAIECAPQEMAQKWYYTRSSSVTPTNSDSRLYDVGVFQVATYGSQAAATIGQLWTTYDITFSKKIMNNLSGLNLRSDKYIMVAPQQSSAYFGTSRTLVSGSNLGTSVSGTVITFPSDISSGTYLINWAVYGASTVVTKPTLTLSGCSALTLYNNNTVTDVDNSGLTAGVLFMDYIVRLSGQSATITLSSGTLPTSPTYGDMVITQINGNIGL